MSGGGERCRGDVWGCPGEISEDVRGRCLGMSGGGEM